MRNLVAQQRARRLRNDATDAERHLWRHLRDRQLAGFRFRRQVPLYGFIADFACLEAKLVIELDGGQHVESVAYDQHRDRLLEFHGYRVLRFWDNQVLQQTQAVLEAILRVLQGISSSS